MDRIVNNCNIPALCNHFVKIIFFVKACFKIHKTSEVYGIRVHGIYTVSSNMNKVFLILNKITCSLIS